MSNPTVAGFRLSVQQNRTWSQQLGHPPPSLWAECELALEGPLDPARLKDSIRHAVSRHEILRTVFHRQTGVKVPFQVILDSPEFGWTEADLGGLDEQAQRSRIRELVNSGQASTDPEKG